MATLLPFPAPIQALPAAGVPVLRVQGLRKAYEGREVLRGVEWQVPPGRVIGLLGRNGAGKTTLLRCLLGLVPIDAGTVDLFGEPMVEPSGERLHRVGFVPQNFELFPWMRVRAYLAFTAAFYARWNHALAGRLLQEWELDPAQKIGRLSQGQRQKLAIARAIAPEPDLLVLDEPVASLDPQARRAFMAELLSLMRGPRKSIIFSTHITADLERADADIALLRDGRIQFTRPLSELKARLSHAILSRSAGWTAVPALAGVIKSRIAGASLHLLLEDVPAERLHQLAKDEDASLRMEMPTLEDLFVELA